MEWKNQLTKTPYLVLFVILISVGVGSAYALVTITLAGDVIVENDLLVEGDTTLENPGGNSDNLLIQRPGGATADNTRFVFSHRSSDQDLWLYGFDGTTFKNFVGFDYPNYLITFPANGDTLVVDASNDRVGIGTTTPEVGLHVQGKSIYLDESSAVSGDFPALWFKTKHLGISSIHHMFIKGTEDNLQESLSIYHSNTAFPSELPSDTGRVLRIDSAGGMSIGSYSNVATFNGMLIPGFVGIGTSSPSQKLDVVGNVEVTGEYLYASPKTHYLSITGGQCSGNNEGFLFGPFQCKILTTGVPVFWDVTLPHGAVVTGFRGHIFSTPGTVTCELHEGVQNEGIIMATITRTNVGWGDTAEDTTINSATIDNANNAYAVECNSSSGGVTSTVGELRIRYTTTMAQ